MFRKMGPGDFEPTGEGAPDWAVTYGDLMSLLLVFFVLIASYSTLDVVKYRDLVGSVQTALGTRDRTLDNPQLDSSPTAGIASAAEERERRWVEREVEATVREIGGPLQMIHSREGLRIRIDGQVLFETGKSEIRPEAMPLLQRLAPPLRRYPYRVLVEGHTDDVPIQTALFPSNWELSAARAASVVRYLISQGEVRPDHLTALGYADTRPVAPNVDETTRARNRRVEFLLSLPQQNGPDLVPNQIPDSIAPFLPEPEKP
ncbi:MAG: flagellar motor protein MotB [Candidatus Eisenbacteria bacterium]|uniref:Flagellar motor protein MotB n=1 Tax=Eiseniibacteriota bacterium TaxID=2212470 RepID=A0A956LWA3_UNCEI|nr:flagellar motor protein MotB [Candidatus Eisenbacteria bacterium]